MTRPQGPPVSLPTSLLPSPVTLKGQTTFLQHLEPSHASPLFPLIAGSDPLNQSVWDYIPEGPYLDIESFTTTITAKSASTDPFFFSIHDPKTSLPVGYFSLMRITPDHLTVEVGHVLLSPSRLQRSTAATEAFYLLIKHAFEDLGYRRVEWKCHSLNEASARAARRLGFVFEGTFRQHMVIKGRNRDTMWFSMLKDEWEGEGGVKKAFEGWLDEGNFDAEGRQKKRLEEFRS